MAISEIVDADIPLRRVVDVKLCALRREGEPVGLVELLGEQLDLAIGGESVNTLKGDFLLLTLRQVRGWVGKVNRAIRTKHHIVGAVQALALVAVGEISCSSCRRARGE